MSKEDRAHQHGHHHGHDHGILQSSHRESAGALGRLGFAFALLLCPADDILTAVASATMSAEHNHDLAAIVPPAVGVVTASETRRKSGKGPKMRPQGSVFQSSPITKTGPRFESYVRSDARNTFPNGAHRRSGGYISVVR